MHQLDPLLKVKFGDPELGTKLSFYEFKDDLTILGHTSIKLSNFCMFHDIACTEDYFIASNVSSLVILYLSSLDCDRAHVKSTLRL